MDKQIILSLLYTLITIPMMAYAQPQYRVFMVPPAGLTATATSITQYHYTRNQLFLCFREIDSTDPDLTYCPLGNTTIQVNGGRAPIRVLEFGDGSNTIPRTYPRLETSEGIVRGFGLLVAISGISTLNYTGNHVQMDTHLIQRIGGLPGEIIDTGSQPIVEGIEIFYSLSVGAECLPEFTGEECNTPVTTTTIGSTDDHSSPTGFGSTDDQSNSSPTTTGGFGSTDDQSNSSPTTGGFGSTDNQSNSSPTTTGGSRRSDDQSSSPTKIQTTTGEFGSTENQFGITAGVGWGVAILLFLLLLIALIFLTKKWKIKGEYKDGDGKQIEMARNPAYTSHFDTTEPDYANLH